MFCSHSSSGKQKGKKSGGKEKPKNIKSNTGAEELPEVCIVQHGFIFFYHLSVPQIWVIETRKNVIKWFLSTYLQSLSCH